MKILIAIALITVIPVKGRLLNDQYSSEVESQSGAEPQDLPQDEPIISQDTGDNYEGTEELVRIARQYPSAFTGMANSWSGNPAARTLLGGLGGLSGSLQQNVRLGMGSPGPSPLVPLPLAHALPASPVQMEPYIAGYSLMPVYSQRQLPLMPPLLPAAPCPHGHQLHAPYTFPPPVPALPPSPGMFFNRQLNMGMGRSAHDNHDEHHSYHPFVMDPSYVRSSEPIMFIDPSQYLMMEQPHHSADHRLYSMEPSNLVAQSVTPDSSSAPAEQLPSHEKDSNIDSQTNVGKR